MLRKMKDCFAAFEEQLKAGEEVDMTSVCQAETEALINYTVKVMDNYKLVTPVEISEKRSRYYTPMQPYFQNL